MEPERQIEIQLGHMCNNRCVFCVSGQRTEMREALPIAADPVLEHLRDARSNGITKVTLLGGEPTIQPQFFRVLGAAVELGFSEIVIFTNGVKTARGSFVDEILATGGNFTFRLSFQGGTSRAHEQTTKKLGSFARLVETLGNLRDRGQRITVNMCVVRSNFGSVEAFPSLLLPYGVSQLHLDMVRPLDAGVRSEDEMRAMIPRYSDMVPHLERMVAGFPDGFDVNIGNVPFCIAPSLAPYIHHDGTRTLTVSIDDRDSLSEPWDKYETKRRDKVKPESCRECVFDNQCSGVFDTYRRFYGVDELRPITRARLPVIDPAMRLFTLHAEPLIEQLSSFEPEAPFARADVRVDSHAQQVVATFSRAAGEAVRLALRRPGTGALSTDRFSLHLLEGTLQDPSVARLVRALFSALSRGVDIRVARCIARVGAGAPYGGLAFSSVKVEEDGAGAVVEFLHREGVGVSVVVAAGEHGLRVKYRLDRELPTVPAGLADDVRAALVSLRAGQELTAAR